MNSEDIRNAANAILHERRRQAGIEASRRMVNYMLAWDGRQVRRPFQYELRQKKSPADVLPFAWRGRP